jgi:hypothetical protein
MSVNGSHLDIIADLRGMMTARLTKLKAGKSSEDSGTTMMNLIPPFTTKYGARTANDVFYKENGLLARTIYKDVCANVHRTPISKDGPVVATCETIQVPTVVGLD